MKNRVLVHLERASKSFDEAIIDTSLLKDKGYSQQDVDRLTELQKKIDFERSYLSAIYNGYTVKQ